MRFAIYGAGAIGGVLGGRLFEHGHDVVLLARGAHLDAIRERGLTVETADGTVTLPVPVAGHPSEVDWTGDDVVVLAMKSQDTGAALDALSPHVSVQTPIVCAQNGVNNERVALRRFERVYGMCVMCPATHLEPGIVQASSTPVTGLMDVGRWPKGSDEIADSVAAALSASTFSSIARDDISRWKWGKLLNNLGNAVEATCRRDESAAELAARARREGVACLGAANVEFVSGDEDGERRGALLTVKPIGEKRRGGGSTWQSLTRSMGTVETDYLTGEIVLMGRLFGVATPANVLLQSLTNEMARAHEPPGTRSAAQLLARLPDEVA